MDNLYTLCGFKSANNKCNLPFTDHWREVLIVELLSFLAFLCGALPSNFEEMNFNNSIENQWGITWLANS